MSISQIDLLRDKVKLLNDYFEKTIDLFIVRIDEMEKSSKAFAEVSQQLDETSAENARRISDLNINLRELQEKKGGLEKKKRGLEEDSSLLEEAGRRNKEELERLQQHESGLTTEEAGLKEKTTGLQQEVDSLTTGLTQIKPDFDKNERKLHQKLEDKKRESERIEAAFKALTLLVQKKYLQTPEIKILEMIATQKGSMTTDILVRSTGLQKSIVETTLESLRKRNVMDISESGELTVLNPTTLNLMFQEKEA